MANAMDALDDFIREELPAVIMESLPAIAPIYNYVKTTSTGVTSNAIGRGWKVRHLYGTGVAGLMETSNPAGPTILGTGEQVRMLDFATSGALTPFPTAAEAPHTGSLQRQLTLHMMTGNFSVPVTWMQADALNSSQIQQVARDIKAVGELKALLEACSFFSLGASDGTYTFDVLSEVSSVSVSNNDPVITIAESSGRICNFRVGMKIDVVADSGSDVIQSGTATDGTDVRNYDASGNYVHLIVTDVDYLNKTVTCQGINDSDGSADTYDATNGYGDSGTYNFDAGDWIVLARTTRTAASRPVTSWGLEDWIASSGTIMGGASSAEALDLDLYSQFKSFVKAVNGPVTDTVMNGYVGGFLDSYTGAKLDTILTTQGVTLKYLEQPTLSNNRLNYDRTGKALSMQGGWSDIGYSFNGRELRWIISPMCLTNRMYVIKLGGGNIQRYIPPQVGGSDSRIGGEVQFLAPLGGHNGIFKIAHASSGASEDVLEAPFWQYKLVAPTDVKSIKLTGLTEATMT